MKIFAANRHGGKSISDLVIILKEGDDFIVLRNWIDDFFKQNKASECLPGSGNHRTRKISNKLRELLHPLNDKPEHYLDL